MTDQQHINSKHGAPPKIAQEERKEQNPAVTGQRESFFGKQSTHLDDWITIEPDGYITAHSGKVELGTGTRTALAQIVAEELDVPFERVCMIMGDTAHTPDEGYTAGSMTIMMSGKALRQAAAEARHALLEMAAQELKASPDKLMIKEGAISVRDHPARVISYSDLMRGKRFNREVTGQAPLKRPQEYHIVGTSVPRVDLPPKFTGQPSFVQDIRLPGMLHGRIVYPPSPGAKLISIDEQPVQGMAGLVKVVHRGNFVGVIAEREEQAILVAKQIKLQWQEDATLPTMETLHDTLRAQQPAKEDVLVENGDVNAILQGSAQLLHATYCTSYLDHASIGPSCAVADVTPGQATIWSSTQGPHPIRGGLAQLLNMPPEKVRVIHAEGAGCYGHNGADDAAADAALLSQAVGRPVRVQWSRQQEFIWEPKGPAMVMELYGGLDKEGNILAWDYQVWSPTHAARPRFAGQFLAAQWMTGQAPPPARYFIGGERNAPTNYTFPAQRVCVHWLATSPLRASSLRSLGGFANTFANESFMDELAAAANSDPLEFRLHYLSDSRSRAVLSAVAERANWEAHPSHQRKQTGVAQGRGIAFAQYENSVAYIATVAYVEVDTMTGVVRVKRIITAHDCGLIINPDGLRNQIEGNIIQSLSRSLKEAVHFDQNRVTSIDWQSYPIMTFSEVPDIEILLIDHPDLTAVGAGEPSTVTTAAALGNAIFDATGVRLRQLPFTSGRVKAALEAK